MRAWRTRGDRSTAAGRYSRDGRPPSLGRTRGVIIDLKVAPLLRERQPFRSQCTPRLARAHRGTSPPARPGQPAWPRPAWPERRRRRSTHGEKPRRLTHAASPTPPHPRRLIGSKAEARLRWCSACHVMPTRPPQATDSAAPWPPRNKASMTVEGKMFGLTFHEQAYLLTYLPPTYLLA